MSLSGSARPLTRFSFMFHRGTSAEMNVEMAPNYSEIGVKTGIGIAAIGMGIAVTTVTKVC